MLEARQRNEMLKKHWDCTKVSYQISVQELNNVDHVSCVTTLSQSIMTNLEVQ